MSLNAGSVTAQRGADGSVGVNVLGVVVADASSWFDGSGLALAMAEAHFDAVAEAFTADTVRTLAGKQSYGSSHTLLSDTLLSIAQSMALQANAYASAIISHVTAHAVVPAAGLLDHGGGACSGSTTVT